MTNRSQPALAQPLRSGLRKMSNTIQNISMIHSSQPKKYIVDRKMSSSGYPLMLQRCPGEPPGRSPASGESDDQAVRQAGHYGDQGTAQRDERAAAGRRPPVR